MQQGQQAQYQLLFHSHFLFLLFERWQRTKGESSGDEDRAYTLESVCKGTWVTPESTTNILIIEAVARAATTNADAVN